MFSKCRACLGLSENMKLLSENDPQAKHLISMFTSIVNFEWIENDQIASYICSECECALEISYKFQKKCQESHKIITKLLDENDPLKLEGGNDARGTLDQDCDSTDENPKQAFTKMAKTRVKKFSEEEVNQAVNEYKDRQNSGLRCIVCDYVLTTLRALSTHMTQSHKDIRESWCYICNKIYSDLPEHRQVHKNSVEICQFCNKPIKKKYFIDHLRMHSGVKPYECQICGRGFLTNSSLRVHYNYHKQRGINVKNPLEEVIYNDESKKIKIEDTENVINLSSDRLNYCVTCNRNVRSLPDHVNKVHYKVKVKMTDAKMYSCQICNKQFRANSSLQLHLRLHRGETPYKCSYCGKPHKSRAQMKDHERTHTGEKPYICSVCGKGFAQSGALGTHMRQHTGRPELCKICQKRFCRPSELKLHLRKHSGEKPYLCTECGKTFIQKSHLTEHAKTHSDHRPHQCSYCEKAFKQKSLLTSHLQIHAGYKRFKCTMCSYACFKAYRLQQHMKLHNSEVKDFGKVHVCPICQRGFASRTMLNAHKSASHNAIV